MLAVDASSVVRTVRAEANAAAVTCESSSGRRTEGWGDVRAAGLCKKDGMELASGVVVMGWRACFRLASS